MSLFHFSLVVFVKQVKNIFKPETSLSIQVYMKVIKKGEWRKPLSFINKTGLQPVPRPVEHVHKIIERFFVSNT